MSQQTTKKHVQSAFEMLCKTMGKRVATGYNDVGAWSLDYVACYGGYVIEEICGAAGGVNQPFGQKRMNRTQFYDSAWFTIRAIEIMQREAK